MWLCGVFIPKPSRIGAGDYRLISCCFSRSRSNTVLPSIRRLLHNLLAFRAFSRMVSEVTAHNRRTLITICCRRVLSKYFFPLVMAWKKKMYYSGNSSEGDALIIKIYEIRYATWIILFPIFFIPLLNYLAIAIICFSFWSKTNNSNFEVVSYYYYLKWITISKVA